MLERPKNKGFSEITVKLQLISTILQKSLLSVLMAVSSALMPGQPTVLNNDPVTIEFNLTTPEGIEGMIRQKARLNKIEEEKVIFIARCESQLDPSVIGDGHLTCKATGNPIRSRGIWQINECAHPEVSDAEAFDPALSTDWAMEAFKKGTESREWKRCSDKYAKEVASKQVACK